jgi:dethiobiotin synthetase
MDPAFHTVADWAAALELPVLVVARAGLGTINHTALTVEALAARKIPCRGVVLVAKSAEEEAAAGRNAEAIRRLAGAEIFAVIPPLAAEDDWERARLAARVLDETFSGRKLDPETLLA